MLVVGLTQGKVALIDKADHELVNRWKWSYDPTGYARRNERGRKVYLHRQLMGEPIDLEVDHINGDKLDNRRRNLRVCTSAENKRNTGIRRTNTSGYKGVTWQKNRQKWKAQIQYEGVNRHLGLFINKEDAARAYASAAESLFGDFARVV